MIYAAIYDVGGYATKFMTAPAFILNLNIPDGGTWREMPPAIVMLEDVPPSDTMPVHPDMVEPA